MPRCAAVFLAVLLLLPVVVVAQSLDWSDLDRAARDAVAAGWRALAGSRFSSAYSRIAPKVAVHTQSRSVAPARVVSRISTPCRYAPRNASCDKSR